MLKETVMARAPFQVLVLPFRARADCLEFALFRRRDAGYWQGVAGGGEMGETPLATARRECLEEANIPESARYFRLDTEWSVPVSFIADHAREHWPRGLYVIPAYSFAVDATAHEIVISEEHTEYAWLEYDSAHELLHWHNDKTALRELSERLQRGDMDA